MVKYFIPILVFLFVSCRETTVTGRKQMAMMPDNMVVQMSQSAYQRFLLENKMNILLDGPEQELVRKVGNKLSVAVDQYLSQNNLKDKLPAFEWEFNVLKNDAVANAWCLPGGKMMVYTGMLPLTSSELGMAVVMSHEIAHAVAGHGNVRMSQQMLSQTGFMALDMALMDRSSQDARDLYTTAYGLSLDPVDMLAYIRIHETEADELGMIFMAMAGYDPQAAVAFWRRAASLSADKTRPQYFNIHSPGKNRISKLREHLPGALRYYTQPK